MTDELSDRAKTILFFLQAYIAEHGYAPTQRQIGTACAITSTSSVNYWLKRLVDAGWIKFQAGTSRTIVLLERAPAGGPEEGWA